MDSEAIFGAVRSVTKAWAKQRRAEEREASRRLRRYEVLTRSREVTISEAAWRVMPQAYLRASSNGTLPAHARQIMYAARGEIQRLTGRQLNDQYFTQTLLPDYLRQHPEETAGWDVVFDARGHLREPHTGQVVPLGTIEVRRHLRAVASHQVTELDLANLALPASFPTRGPEHRYGAILFVEKEGFMPLFEAVGLAERYDVAIMSTKGLSVTASRQLVDQLCSRHRIPLLVLHDFDKAGFSILGTLRRDTRRYAFESRIEVLDLGLRLADVEEHDLEAEDVIHRSNPAWNLRKNGATEEEILFLREQRVELNAFASADLVAWIEAKLEQHGISKVVPDDACLCLAYRRALEAQHVGRRLGALARKARAAAAVVEVPADLRQRVEVAVCKDPTLAWDDVLRGIARDMAPPSIDNP